MENKTSTIVLINVIFLLLLFRFGSIFLFVIALAGVVGIYILVISFKMMGAYAPTFYVEKFSPLCKKITGSYPPELKEQSAEESKREARGLLILTAGIITIILLIYTVLTRLLN